MFISLIWFHFFFCLFFYSQYDRRDIKILTKRLILIMPTASNTYYSESDLILTICSLVCHFNVWADIISLYSFFFHLLQQVSVVVIWLSNIHCFLTYCHTHSQADVSLTCHAGLNPEGILVQSRVQTVRLLRANEVES